MIVPLPGATGAKPGSATRPFFGVKPALVDNDGQILDGATEGTSDPRRMALDCSFLLGRC